jgi:hypothetical protein
MSFDAQVPMILRPSRGRKGRFMAHSAAVCPLSGDGARVQKRPSAASRLVCTASKYHHLFAPLACAALHPCFVDSSHRLREEDEIWLARVPGSLALWEQSAK